MDCPLYQLNIADSVVAPRRLSRVPSAEHGVVPRGRCWRGARARLEADLPWLPESALALRDPEPPRVRLSQRLARLCDQVQAELSGRYSSAPWP